MQAVLYISHGSRVKESVAEADAFLRCCMKGIASPIQQICYLELVQPDIHKGIDTCVRLGATQVIVQPLLLLSAGHAKRDIPREIRRAQARYPQITFKMGLPFGVDERIVDVLVKRLTESNVLIGPKDVVLLVGRGSSDPEIAESFALICRMMKLRGFQNIAVCYLAATKPTLQDALMQFHARLPKGRLFLLPYLLFPGLLKRIIDKAINDIGGGSNLVLCQSLGFHPILCQLLRNKVQGMIEDDSFF
ncbi:sirohydrochlorin chelatase [Sporolactobacillus spathodeae]|uniref:Sirohydrochlorin ferrochelatase n=1 Tax=Sporolactobacillus spathodeae TaxID=1465502 RepID=A0ABS2QBF7_9BACL|nr:sirohydrochlorin chelatase [Sporolactobacillus spathodeae]MBM7658740.1 sirohydrochlorin ferrochelatase [Sporolactobacillus spathodeae]